MKFVRVVQDFETFVSGKGTTVIPVESYINIDNIELIRVADNKVVVFFIGDNKSIKLSDEDSIKRLLKECKIDRKQKINEEKNNNV